MTSLAFGRKLIVLTDFQFRARTFGMHSAVMIRIHFAGCVSDQMICKNAVSKCRWCKESRICS